METHASIKSYKLVSMLSRVNWQVAAYTYGNDHATLIGLIVNWWVSMSVRKHRALEGGPANGYAGKGVRGQCDALLCKGNEPAGVLEVEGSRHLSTIDKLGSFFAARRPEYRSLSFGILLLYTYEAKDSGRRRHLPRAATPRMISKLRKISKKYPKKAIILITLDKKYIRQKEGIRSRSPYYFGEPNRIVGRLFLAGKQKGAPKVFYSKDVS